MATIKTDAKRELLSEIKNLPQNLVQDVLGFVCFIKARRSIDPTQAYFWTRKWQEMEKEADQNIRDGKINKYSSVKEFLRDFMLLADKGIV